LARVLVTGAAGFIGSFLVERLLQDDNHVTGLDNLFRGRRDNLAHLEGNPRFRQVKADLLEDYSAVAELLSEGIDVIYHLAAINGTRYFYERPFDVLRVNAEGTINLLRAVEQHPVAKVVFASSSEVYGEPMTIPVSEDHPFLLNGVANPRHSYAASKVMGEYYVRWSAEKFGFDWVNLRIFNSYGPRMDTSQYGQVVPEFIQRILSNEPFTLFGLGTQTRSFCYVEDTAEMMVRAGERVSNDALNIGNDKEISILALAELIHQVMGRPFEYTFLIWWKGIFCGAYRTYPRPGNCWITAPTLRSQRGWPAP
jgi:nucleoside-diphosphate-sugar epimerase